MVSNIRFVSGDILKAKTALIVIPVNCVGVMGAGLAKQFKDQYPALEDILKDANLTPGSIKVIHRSWAPDFVFFATKDHWRDPSKLEWIESGLGELAAYCKKFGMMSVAIPAVGCGLGGLKWSVVKAAILEALEDIAYETAVYVYVPKGERGFTDVYKTTWLSVEEAEGWKR